MWVGHGVHPCTPKRHTRQIAPEPLGGVIRNFCYSICCGLVDIELCASRYHTQRDVAGIRAQATRPTIERGSLNVSRPHQGIDGTADALSGLQHLITGMLKDEIAPMTISYSLVHGSQA